MAQKCRLSQELAIDQVRKRMFPSTFDGEKKSARNFYQERFGTNKHRETSKNKRETRCCLTGRNGRRRLLGGGRRRPLWRCRKPPVLRHVILKLILYQDRLRDKHRESTPKKVAFAFGAAAGGEEGQQQQLLSVLCEPTDLGRLCNEVRASGYTVTEVRKTPFLRRHFILGLRRSDRFTKTGSGQT